MLDEAKNARERSRRFLEAALPCLDDAYRLARFLLRNPADAEDAVQECYLRALRHFGDLRGAAIKPWLLAILRNLCYTEFSRRGRYETFAELAECESGGGELIWQDTQGTPEADLLRRQEGSTIRRLVADLPPIFRDVIVLREINELSYRDIADMTGTPLGTVMSRLARARAMLRASLHEAGLAPQRAPAKQAAPATI